jgi:hypothetical protein
MKYYLHVSKYSQNILPKKLELKSDISKTMLKGTNLFYWSKQENITFISADYTWL